MPGSILPVNPALGGLNPSSNPKTMTISGTSGPNRGKIFSAIYKLNGDTPRVCHDLSGKKHPTEFKSPNSIW